MNFLQIFVFWCMIVIFASSASILTRFCDIPATDIGFWRVLGAGLLLLPIAVVTEKKQIIQKLISKGTILTGLFLGLHFASWCWAIQHTSIANATLFIGIQPLMIPIIARIILGDKTNRWEIVALCMAFIGTVWIGIKQLDFNPAHFEGVIVAIFSALLCSIYIVLGRKYRKDQSAVVFSAGIFIIAAIVQAVLTLTINGQIKLGNRQTILAILGLIIFPTIGGHALMLYLLRYARPMLISFTIPTQFLLATIAAFYIFKEVPQLWFYPGAVAILSGIVLGILKTERSS